MKHRENKQDKLSKTKQNKEQIISGNWSKDVPEREDRELGQKQNLKKIVDDNFPYQLASISVNPSGISTKKNILSCIVIKLLNIKKK